MPGTYFVASENLNATNRRQIAQFDPAETGNGRIIENGTLIWSSFEPKAVNLIVRGKLDAIRTARKRDCRVFVRTAEGLPRRKLDRWSAR